MTPTSTCQHCDYSPIEWQWDEDDDGVSTEFGWWIGGIWDTEVCAGTDDGWHRPLGATEDNEPPTQPNPEGAT